MKALTLKVGASFFPTSVPAHILAGLKALVASDCETPVTFRLPIKHLLPTGTTYVPGSLTITDGPWTATPSTAVITDNVLTWSGLLGGNPLDVPDAIIVSQHHAGSRWPSSHRLDATGLTVEQSLEAAVRRGLLPG